MPMSPENRALVLGMEEPIRSTFSRVPMWELDALLNAARAEAEHSNLTAEAQAALASVALRRIADDPIDEPATWGGAAEWMRRIARDCLTRMRAL
jgi:hypothetical protein